MASLNDSHFDLFDLPAQFALDAAALRRVPGELRGAPHTVLAHVDDDTRALGKPLERMAAAA